VSTQAPPAPGTGLRSLTRLLPWLRSYRGLIAFSLLAFLLARLLQAAVPLLLATGIDRLAAGHYALLAPALGIVGCVLARFFVVAAARIAIRRAGIGVAFDLRQGLFGRLQRQGNRFFTVYSTGDMMTRAVADVRLIRRLVSMGTIMTVVIVYATVVGFTLMAWLSPVLTMLILPPLPIVALYAWRGSRRMNAASQRTQRALSTLTDHAQGNFAGIRTIQALVQEDAEIARFERRSDAYADAFYEQSRISSAMGAVMPSLAAACTLIVLGYGGAQVLAGTLSPGTFVAFFSYVAMVVQPMRTAGILVNLFQRAAVACERVFAVLDRPDEIPDRPSGAAPRDPRGQLDLEAVQWTYPSGASPALVDVDLHIASGETVAIMGRIGAGKSTLLKLLTRLLEPPPGRVRLDAHPVEDYALAELRRHITLVQQDPFLFAEPVRDNLSYDDPWRAEPEVWRAAELADLAETITRLPSELDTLVGERGVTLSGGQRQRATLARGVIRDAAVLALDDCFASVDTTTEERILETLLELRHNRTTLIVTHRTATARRADRIVVLQAGRIVESGSHAELVGHEGWYARLAAAQRDTVAGAPAFDEGGRLP